MNDLMLMFEWVKTVWSQIIVLIFGHWLLSVFFAIFIINRVSKLLQKIR